MPKYHVLLDQKTADALREQGINSLSKGIELMFRARTSWEQDPRTGPTKRTTATPEPALPIDPRNLSGHGGTKNRLARQDREVAERAVRELAFHRGYLRDEIIYAGDLDRIHGAIRDGSTDRAIVELPEDWHVLDNYFTPEEQAEIYAEHEVSIEIRRARSRQAHVNAAETKRLRDAGLPDTRTLAAVQTTKLTVTAMRRLGLFGTPEGLTDAQIAELNEGYKDATPTDGIGEGIYEEYNPNADNE